jgi:hypothetical protein
MKNYIEYERKSKKFCQKICEYSRIREKSTSSLGTVRESVEFLLIRNSPDQSGRHWLRWPTLVRSIPGQQKIKGGTLCVWNRKFLFLLWKVLIHEKSLLERIFISRFSSVNKFSIICNEIIKEFVLINKL